MLLNIAFELAKHEVHSQNEGEGNRIGFIEYGSACFNNWFVISSMDDLTVLTQTEKDIQRVVNKCLIANSKNKDVLIINNIQCSAKGGCDLKCSTRNFSLII